MQALHFYLPVFNGEDFITELIDSVLLQDIPNWSLTILDNASTDTTRSILEKYIDPRITYFRYENYLSIEKSFFRVLEHLPGSLDELISVLGHDDILYPSFAREMLALSIEFPKASIFHSHFTMIDAEGKLLRPCKPMPLQESYEEFVNSRSWGLRDSYGVGYVFKARDFLEVGGYPQFPSLLYSDDFLVAKLSAISYKICSTNTLFSYRVNRRSTSGQFSGKRFLANIQALESYIDKIRLEFPDYFLEQKNACSMAFQIHRLESLLNSPLARPLLSLEDRSLIDRLANLKMKLYKLDSYDQIWGGNFLISKVYPFFLRIYVVFSLIKSGKR